MLSEIKKIDLQEKLYSIKANNPFEDFSYLRAMEQSNSASEKSGWIPDHLGEIENKKLISFLPLYKKFNSYGEFIFDQQWAHALQQTGRDYYPKLLTAIPFTPCEGERILAPNDKKKIHGLLISGRCERARAATNVHATKVQDLHSIKVYLVELFFVFFLRPLEIKFHNLIFDRYIFQFFTAKK